MRRDNRAGDLVDTLTSSIVSINNKFRPQVNKSDNMILTIMQQKIATTGSHIVLCVLRVKL